MIMTMEHAAEAGQMITGVSERRRGLRIRQSRPVKILDTIGGRYYGGLTRDVSTTGLRIELPAFTSIQSGSIVNVYVGLDDKGQTLANRRSMLPAKVIWIGRPHAKRKTVTAGIELTASVGARLDAA